MITFSIAGPAIHPRQELRSCLTSWWNQAQVRLSSSSLSVGGRVFPASDVCFFPPLSLASFGATFLVLQVALLRRASRQRAGEHFHTPLHLLSHLAEKCNRIRFALFYVFSPPSVAARQNGQYSSKKKTMMLSAGLDASSCFSWVAGPACASHAAWTGAKSPSLLLCGQKTRFVFLLFMILTEV